jgi:hypothetical protein
MVTLEGLGTRTRAGVQHAHALPNARGAPSERSRMLGTHQESALQLPFTRRYQAKRSTDALPVAFPSHGGQKQAGDRTGGAIWSAR